MPIYENGVIYKLKHNEDYDDLNIYIGSTTNFKNRKYQHKNNCIKEKKLEYNYRVYQFIRANGGWNEWVMIAIEEYPCDSKKKLETRERYHIDFLRPTLNKIIPTRTDKEYREDNKEKIKEQGKKYRDANKEKIKEWRDANKEKIKGLWKAYSENNKEKRKEQSKIYYEANKEKIFEKYNEYRKQYYKKKVICDHCGCDIRKHYLKQHQKTKKCINFKKD